MVSDSHGFITKLLACSSEPQALDYYDGLVDVQSNSVSHERTTNTRKPSLSRSQQNSNCFPTSPLGRKKNAASMYVSCTFQLRSARSTKTPSPADPILKKLANVTA